MMRAGVCSFDIAPVPGVPLGGNPRLINAARSVHDPLSAHVLCLNDDKASVLLIGLDLLGIDTKTCDAIKTGILEQTGIAQNRVMIFATHTHSGPNVPKLYFSAYRDEAIKKREHEALDQYLSYLISQTIKAAAASVENLFLCRIGYGFCEDDRFSCNRRLRMRDGSIRMIFEPYELSDIVALSEPASAPRLSVIRVDDLAGNVRGVWVHYATHPAIACGLDYAISRDYVGYLDDKIRAALGSEVVVLYANGAEGNLSAARPERGFINSFEECRRVGEGLADSALKVISAIHTTADIQPLRWTTDSLALPIREFSQEEVDQAEKIIENTPTEISPHGAPQILSAIATRAFHARSGESEKILLQGLSIGNILLLAAPTETFRQIAAKAELLWRRGPAVFVGLANGYSGYVPTEAAFSEGGYEVLPNEDSYFAPDAEHLLSEALAKIVREMENSF